MKASNNKTVYTQHPKAKLIPPLPESEREELKKSMKRYGQLVPILKHGSVILDGWNRYQICMELAIDPRFDEYDGDADALAEIVLVTNALRRQLTTSQRSMIAAELETMKHGGDRRDATLHLNQVTRLEAATKLDVSPRTVATAKKVLDEASPEIVEAVKEGKLTVTEAAREIKPKPKRKRKARPEPPAYEPPPDEQAKLDSLEHGLSKLSEFIDKSGVVNILLKLDRKERRRWLDVLLLGMFNFYKKVERYTRKRHVTE
jgi:ParB-like chromosome segregation protein Spo0J